MRTRLIVATVMLALALASGIICPSARAYPEPSIVPSAWQFDFTWGKPSLIALKDLNDQQQWYWYISYKVINNTGEERDFFPEFTMYTDEGEIVTSGDNVPASAFDAIARRLANPHLQSPIQVVGKLLQGEDYAKSSVAVWPAAKRDVDSFDIFVNGLSGETKTVIHPLTNETLVMSKTLMISFDTPGTTAPDLQGQEIIPTNTRWVMR